MTKLLNTVVLLFSFLFTTASSWENSTSVSNSTLIESGSYAFQFVNGNSPLYLTNSVHAKPWKVAGAIAGSVGVFTGSIVAFAALDLALGGLALSGAAAFFGSAGLLSYLASYDARAFQVSSKPMAFNVEVVNNNYFRLISSNDELFHAVMSEAWTEDVYITNTQSNKLGNSNIHVGSAVTSTRQIYHPEVLFMSKHSDATLIQAKQSTKKPGQVTLWMNDFAFRVPVWFKSLRSVQLNKRIASEWKLIKLE